MTAYPSWADVEHRFEQDGSLRDVYILNTTRDDWKKFLSFLVTSPMSAEMTRGDEKIAVELPDDFPFWAEGSSTPLLHFKVANLLCASHFFSADVIEFDIVPQDLHAEDQFDVFIAFLNEISHLLGRDVIVTEENTPDDVIVSLPASKGRN